MSKNIVNKKIETIFFTIILLVFILGFFAGWNFSDKTLSESQIKFQKTQLDLRSIYERSQFEDIFDSDICNQDLIKSLSQTLYKTGLELDQLEKERKIETNYYDFLKKRHNLNQVLFYSEYKKSSQKCNLTSNMVLFFFNGSDEESSRMQGEELNKLSLKHTLLVLPMDYNYTSNLEYFYKFYEVRKLPTLIINFKSKLEGIQSAEDIEKYLKKRN